MAPVDFKVTSKDTGLGEADSIQPITNAEVADQTVFRRPPENLRTRTEALRVLHDNEEAVDGLWRSMAVMQVGATTPEVTWNGVVAGGGDGKMVLTQDVYVSSATSVASAPGGVPTSNIVVACIYDDSVLSPDVFIVRADIGGDRAMHQGAGNIFFRMWKPGAGMPLAVTVSPAVGADPALGPVEVDVQLATDGGGLISSKYTDVVTAINAAAPNIVVAFWGGVPGVDVVANALENVTKTRRRLFEFPTIGYGGVDAMGLKFAAATLNGLVLEEGWGVVASIPTAADMRAYTFASVPSLLRTVSPTDPLSLTGDNQSFPICKVFNDRLYFFNGVMANKAQKVHLIPDNNLRPELAVQTAASSGTRLVGAEAQAGAPLALAGGTVFSQLGLLQTAYNGHSGGTADFHNIGAIHHKPYAVVDPVAGQGDYQTIQTALTAMAATGGTIFVQPGTYVEALVAPTPCKDLFVVGTDPTTTIVEQVAGANAVLTVETSNTHWFNLQFRHTVAASYVIDTATTPARAYLNIFENCLITRVTNPGAVAMVRQRSENLRFINCTFTGLNSHNDVAIEWTTNVGVATDVSVERCTFTLCEKLIVGTGGAGTIGKLVFVDNVITTCGYWDGATAVALIELNAATAYVLDDVLIARNRWATGGAADACGAFCNVTMLNGLIQDNQLLVGMTATPAASPQYMIMVDPATVTADRVTVAGNRIVPDHAGAVYSSGASLIRGNRVVNFAATNTAVPAISAAAYSHVDGNVIDVTSVTASMPAILVTTGAGYYPAQVTNNTITTLQNAQYGIVLNSSGVIVSGNWVRGVGAATTCYGILVSGTAEDCIVRGNFIHECRYGVYTTQSTTLIEGNRISLSSAGASAGVYASGDYATISGNFIKSGVVGVHVDKDYACIVGNNIVTCATGITISESGGSTGAYVQCTGNRIFDATIGIDLTDATLFNVSGNHICTLTGVAAIGIDAHRGGGTNLYGAICGNFLYHPGGTADGADAFDVTNVQYCSMSNNTLLPAAGVPASGWATSGLPGAGATAVGAGPDYATHADDANNVKVT